MRNVDRVIWTLALSLIVPAIAPVNAQQHDHAALGDAGKFYESWYVPNGNEPRVSSCCNRKDCSPIRVEHGKDGKWRYFSKYYADWRVTPESLLEHNQPDPRISPDGQAHGCENPNTGQPLCFVLGGDT